MFRFVIDSIVLLLKYIRRKIFNTYCRIISWFSLLGSDVVFDGIASRSGGMYIITIAYNEENLIRKQIELLKLFIKDPGFHHVIVDNSSDKRKRVLIQEICEEQSVEYVPVPRYINKLIFPRLFGFGVSHGAALNWMFYKFLIHRNPDRFVLLDHDIFPIRECNLTELLAEKAFYGVKRDRIVGWYLWPGYSIFNFATIPSDVKWNFFPVIVDGVFLDAGGANYPTLFKYYDIDKVVFAIDKTYRLQQTEGLKDVYHGDCIQIIDDSWLHIINGSNYAHIDGKEEKVAKIIENIDHWFNFNA